MISINQKHQDDINATTSSFHTTIQSEVTAQLFSANITSVIANALNAFILAFVMWPVIPQQTIIYWLSILILVSIGRVLLSFLYNARDPKENQTLYWKNKFILAALLSAVLWFAAALFLFPQQDVSRQVFLAFVIGGTAAGAVTSLSHIKPLVFTYLTLLMLPLIVQFLFNNSTISISMGAMLIIYSAYIFSSANRTHHYLNQNIHLRIKAVNHEQALQAANTIAENANQAKSLFLSQMSHELRTPINAMLGFAQLLELDIKNSQQRDNVNEILKAGNHLISLIDQILDLSKIEAGSYQQTLIDYHLDAILEASLTLISPLAKSKNIQIINAVTDSHMIYIDKNLFTQVLLNLLSNAIKYNSEGGTVSVSSQKQDDKTLILSIADSGDGLTQQQIDSLFVPFTRLPVHKHIEGTGIGLSICKKLIEAMNGHISMQSEVGKGSIVNVTIALSKK
jgi:signal transduction histidine kinase